MFVVIFASFCIRSKALYYNCNTNENAFIQFRLQASNLNIRIECNDSTQSKAKQVAITAMVAAIYAILFFGSAPGMLPGFTLLYLPVILLGVFPLWFGWSGLAGCMIGAFIGGVYVEGVAPYAAWVESVTALIIFGLNWLLIPRNAAECKVKEKSYSSH